MIRSFLQNLILLLIPFSLITSAMAATAPDLNEDGHVNLFDYNLLVAGFGNPYTIQDYDLLLSFFGHTITPTSPLSPTPTPPPITNNCPQPLNKTLVGVRFYMALFSTGSNGHYRRSTHEQWLADPKWQDRWPYYTQIRTNTATETTIDIHQDNQEIFDQEIKLAAAACLDYWALETSPLGSKYHLAMYLNSPYKHLLKFALITPMGAFDDPTKWTSYVNKMVELVEDPQYVRVSGRPLIYMEQFNPFVEKLGSATAIERLNQLSLAIKNATGKKPYLTLFNWASDKYYNQALAYSFDAVALYNCRIVESVSGAPYSSLVSGCQTRWERAKSAGIPFVPTAQITYDARPRREAKSGEDADNTTWYQQGTPTEIANHVKSAITWAKNNPTVVTANTVIIAAWSDYYEGGWLEPTLSQGNARLNALSVVLGGVKKPVPSSPYSLNPQPPHAIGQVTNVSLTTGSTVPANQPIIITGLAPAAARLNFKLHTSATSMISTTSMNYYQPDTVSFTATLPGHPSGGPYTLTISSPDIETTTIYNIMVN